MDSFSVAITAGSRMKLLQIHQSFLIAGYFGVFQWFMTIFGWYGGLFLNDLMSTFDHWVAFGILLFIGGKMIYESFKEDDKKIFVLNHKVLFLLALATSIDAFGIGLSYSLLGKPIFLFSLFIGIIAFFFSFFGVYLGKYLFHILKIRWN